MEKDELLRELMRLCFLEMDLSLIISKQPENEEALSEYNKIIRGTETVRKRLRTEVNSLRKD